MRLVFWGTYDTGKPRIRILLRGLRENGVEVLECHFNVWGGIEDKSNISGLISKLGLISKWLLSYPSLVLRYLRLPKHDAVIVGYLGQLDVLVLWPFARLRGVSVTWDAFLSLYNTVVEDRKLVGPRHPIAYFLYAWEWLACRAADKVLLDTRAHGDYFVKLFNIPRQKVEAVFVGAETDVFPPQRVSSRSDEAEGRTTILFYGQFIPLHGIETIILAARQLEGENWRWIIIGRGQEDSRILEMLNEHPLPNLDWIPWVPYEGLSAWIHRADVCLGIFGDSEKAAMVIPNKVFQILASGKTLITRDSPAIRELLSPNLSGVFLVPPAEPKALAEALGAFSKKKLYLEDKVWSFPVLKSLDPYSIGKKLVKILKK